MLWNKKLIYGKNISDFDVLDMLKQHLIKEY